MSELDRVNTFIRLFTANEPRLRGFAMSLIPNRADAEDVLQQANLVLWQKFEQFQVGTNFFAWASRILYLESRDFRKRQLRSRIRFGDEFLEQIADEAATMADELSDRERALGDCIDRLRSDERELLRMRYQSDSDPAGIADTLGRSVEAIYTALSRIRRKLFNCVDRKVRLAP
ncbi:MAG: sigma-70 family RNA polymerase sigma factor [Tepidisphaeraceae bacterium]